MSDLGSHLLVDRQAAVMRNKNSDYRKSESRAWRQEAGGRGYRVLEGDCKGEAGRSHCEITFP